MNITLKVFIYLSSIAWLSYTLISLPNTLEAQSNAVITAVVTIINMVVNDLNK
jgi:hypothetical protein